VGLFSRKKEDPMDVLESRIGTLREVWENFESMPGAVQANATTTMPGSLRKAYAAAKVADAARADSLMAEARAIDVASGPAGLSWTALIDSAMS
jgi:hypothetical protein